MHCIRRTRSGSSHARALATLRGLLPRLIVAALLAVAGMACSTHGDLCERAANCGRGGDLEIDACIVELDANADVADIYDCSDEWDDYIACVDDFGMCEGEDLRGPCDGPRDTVNKCVDDRERGRARVRLVTP